MKRNLYKIIFFLILFLLNNSINAKNLIFPDNLNIYFKDKKGCFAIKPLKKSELIFYGGEACSKRLKPCSTFKILNSLIGLETKVLKNQNTVIPWNGLKQPFDIWEKDHTLESAVKYSVVPYFQEVANRIGKQKMQFYLDLVGYGNNKIGDKINYFWLDNSLQINALEQLHFIERLYMNNLPFNKQNLKIIKKILVKEKTKDYILSGKTGSSCENNKCNLGWFIGYLKTKNNEEYIFVTNIEANENADGQEALKITKNILQDMNLWEIK